ncbi:ImpA family type VI secretion system protein [Aeoliella sp.]|uniref:type VI secretion system protein TssA n=1 Tax=Aeoliella sp. TaxID=2795800 RepID=UPI003CCC278A
MHDPHANTLLCEPTAGTACAVDENYYTHFFAPTFRELRREESPHDFDDATRPDVLKQADWPAIDELCRAALAEENKDLRIACHSIEAQLRLRGLAGLRDGLAQLATIVEEHWGNLLPVPEDDSHEHRSTPIANLLDDPDRGVCFPSTLRSQPLLGTSPSLSCNDLVRIKRSVEAEDEETLAVFRANVPPEYFRDLASTLEQCRDHLQQLSDSLQMRMGDEAPALLNLRAALDELNTLVASELSLLGVGPAAESPQPTEPSAEMPTAAPNTDLLRLDREGLYFLLDQAADRLRGMEPHSPIPYLVKRAVRMGRLPFPALMKQVIREENILSELNREFGIADSDGHSPLA